MSSGETDSDPLWQAFARMRVEEGNLNDHLDLPQVLQLVPPGEGRRALDLGCGLGQASFRLAEKLGYSVVAVDADSELLVSAKKLYSGDRITWVNSTFHDLILERNYFNVIVSCLSFHFVEDMSALLKSCATWLVPGGKLVFSVRHPIRTSNPAGQVSVDGKVGWTVTDYFTESRREFAWLGQRCVNFHRPLSTYFQMLSESGLTIDTIIEPYIRGASSHPSAAESNLVPFFLLISCRKANLT
jgi:ubiquinone/menaquinone biosynthesis C-methylase UbiE